MSGENHLTEAFRFFRDYWRFVKALRSGSHDIVHLNPSMGNKAVLRDGLFLLIVKMFGKRVLIFIHGWDLDYERTLRRRWLWLFRWVYFRADAFIVLAKEFRDKLKEMGCKKTIYCETTTVDDAVFKHANTVSNRQPSTGVKFNILYLSRVEKAKGIYEALDAYAIIKQSHPEATFTVAGDGAELARARAYAAERNLQDGTFPGHLLNQQKHEAFTRANCFFVPTYTEGMPISVLEAMAYGLPVITRPVGGLADFFEDGKMGFITESKEPKVFANYIERLIQNPRLRSKISQYNRAYAKEHFMASEVVKRMEAIYKNVLEGYKKL